MMEAKQRAEGETTTDAERRKEERQRLLQLKNEMQRGGKCYVWFVSWNCRRKNEVQKRWMEDSLG